MQKVNSATIYLHFPPHFPKRHAFSSAQAYNETGGDLTEENAKKLHFAADLRRPPIAYAHLQGSGVCGRMELYQTTRGVLVLTEVYGLPCGDPYATPLFSLAICEGQYAAHPEKSSLAALAKHYDPYHMPHPYHAGDLPPLLGAEGCAFSLTLTPRFTAEETVGRMAALWAWEEEKNNPRGEEGLLAHGEIRRT